MRVATHRIHLDTGISSQTGIEAAIAGDRIGVQLIQDWGVEFDIVGNTLDRCPQYFAKIS